MVYELLAIHSLAPPPDDLRLCATLTLLTGDIVVGLGLPLCHVFTFTGARYLQQVRNVRVAHAQRLART